MMKNEMKAEIKVGAVFTHPTLGNVKVVAIHPLGTVDVKNIYTDRHYRISGLRVIQRIAPLAHPAK